MIDAGEFARNLCEQLKGYQHELDVSKVAREEEKTKNESEKAAALDRIRKMADDKESRLRVSYENDRSSIQSVREQKLDDAKKYWQEQLRQAAQEETDWQQEQENIRQSVLRQLPTQTEAKTVEEAFTKLKQYASTIGAQRAGLLDRWLRPQVDSAQLQQQVAKLQKDYTDRKRAVTSNIEYRRRNAEAIYENNKRQAEQAEQSALRTRENQLRTDLNALEASRTAQESEVERTFLGAEQASQAKLNGKIKTLNEELLGYLQRPNPYELQLACRMLYEKEAAYPGFQPAQTLGDGLLFGQMIVEITNQMQNTGFHNYVEQDLQFALTSSGNRRGLVMPYFRSFSDPAFSTIVNFNNAGRSKAVSTLNAWALQLLMNNPVGKVQFIFISPNDVGRSFASFMRLSEGDERLIGTRIWCDSGDIEAQLEQLRLHAVEVTQRNLQGQYRNILEYNKQAGKNAEPLRFVFAMDYPNGFTQAALDKLLALQGNGPANGIYTILAGRTDDLLDRAGINDPRYNDTAQRIAGKLTGIAINGSEGDLGGQSCMLRISNTLNAAFMPVKLPEDRDLVDDVFTTLTAAARKAQKTAITYEDIMGELVNNEDQWFQHSDDDCVEVPIALTGANQKVNVRLTCKPDPLQNDACHAVITGMIGSGKSVLLKTLIMGLLLKYSAEDVQIFALDFKEGVEFRTFAQYHLRNFRAISIETEPELGLAVLNYLDGELADRAYEFGKMGVDNLEDYRRVMARQGIAHHGMPRLILIIDEYQELLRDPSNPVQKRAAELIAKFVEKGRATSINVVMATQDPQNARALPQSAYGQFGVRIALRNNRESAQILLKNEDDAAQLVNFDSGVAIYNAFAGDENHDVRCRVAFESTETIHDILKRIEEKQDREQTPYYYGRPRILLGSVVDDLDCPLNRFVTTGVIPQSSSFSYELYLGQQMEMFDNFRPELGCMEKSNLLIANGEISGLTTLSFTLRSILLNACRMSEVDLGEKLVTVFDFTRNDQNRFRGFYQLLDAMQQEVTVFGGPDIWHGLEHLQQLAAQKKRQFVFVVGPEKSNRFRMRSDRFEASPADELKKLLWRGPENGMNFVLWTGNTRSFLANHSDMLDAFENRLIGEVSGKEDLEELLLTKGEEMIAPEKTNNAYYWNPDVQNGYMRVRLYAEPTQQWAQDFNTKIKAELDKQRKA